MNIKIIYISYVLKILTHWYHEYKSINEIKNGDTFGMNIISKGIFINIL